MIDSFQPYLQKIEKCLEQDLKKCLSDPFPPHIEKACAKTWLADSISYGVLRGGKRFRPLLSILVAKALRQTEDKALPLGISAELIHSYSLIHDDLPMMDNDDERRGQLANHKVYGETIALLAGDALQPMAFENLGFAYRYHPSMALELIVLLSEATGIKGMVGGQAIDVTLEGEILLESRSSFALRCGLHSMKTGALIRFCAEGAAVACEATEEERKNLREFGEKLGFAFQLADDIADHNEDQPEASGFPYIMGLEETKSYLQEITHEALQLLASLGEEAADLRKLTQWNAQRVLAKNLR